MKFFFFALSDTFNQSDRAILVTAKAKIEINERLNVIWGWYAQSQILPSNPYSFQMHLHT